MKVIKRHFGILFSMYAGALARKGHPMAALAECEMVGDLGEVGIGVECLDCGFYFLDFVKG